MRRSAAWRTNPATELYDLLSGWQHLPHSVTVLTERTPEGSSDWWPDHSRAVRLFDAVQDEAERRSSAVGRRLRIATSGALDRIAHGIFATNIAMNSGHAVDHELFQEGDLVALELFGESWPAALPVHPTIATGLLAFARDARELLLDEASTLDDNSSGYLLKLIGALEEAVASAQRNEGSADVRRLSSELVGALGALLLEGEGEQQDKARKLIERNLTWVKAVIIDKGVGAFFTALGTAGAVETSHYMLPGAGS